MEPINTPSNAQVVSSADVSPVRDNEIIHNGLVYRLASTTQPSAPLGDSVQPQPARDDAQRNLPPSQRRVHHRYSGFQISDSKSVGCFASFDESYTGIQPGEFYRYSDPDLKHRGYF